MKIEAEDLTQKLSDTEERFLVSSITEKYDKFNDQRSAQLTDIKLVRDAIYLSLITHLRAHETDSYLVCRLLLEKKKKNNKKKKKKKKKEKKKTKRQH